jgi:hypothetical protein
MQSAPGAPRDSELGAAVSSPDDQRDVHCDGDDEQEYAATFRLTRVHSDPQRGRRAMTTMAPTLGRTGSCTREANAARLPIVGDVVRLHRRMPESSLR